MPLKLRPLSNRVVVLPDEREEQTESGLHVPSTAKEQPQTGKVVAIGPGYMSEFPVHRYTTGSPELSKYELENTGFERMPMSLGVGDRIFFGKYSGTELQIEHDKFIVLRETDVLAIMVEDEAS